MATPGRISRRTMMFSLLLFNIATWYASLACNECPYTPSPRLPPNLPPVHYPTPSPPTYTPPPVVKPPPVYTPPPVVKPPPVYNPPPVYTPPPVVKPPPVYNPPPVYTPPPVVKPPPVYNPPPVYTPPPVVKPPPVYTPPPVVEPPPVYNPPTIPTPPETTCPRYAPTCPIATVELDACVDVLGGLINIGIGIGIGGSPRSVCCPAIQHLSDWEAASCLCSAVKAKATLNINLLYPRCRRVLEDCGKPVPPCFQCQA